MQASLRFLLITGLCGVSILACDQSSSEKRADNRRQNTGLAGNFNVEYVGSTVCTTCHAESFQDWRGSHHDLAMQVANDDTVLGDFNNAEITVNNVTSRFFKRDGHFVVHTDNAAGQMQDFSISYTFGVHPLQQYLIDFPDGRKQALSIAWDTRARESGGQRWFHIYGDDNIEHSDPLHWTRLNQNWNYQCADCHSTRLEKNYAAGSGRYATTWEEIDVGCEACHGPASRHVQWAEAAQVHQAERHKGFAGDLGNPQQQINGCAQCHARRGIIAEGFTFDKALLDHYQPALLDAGLYHADGQILDEVYVYGSFLQSKMYAQGVTCTDCHNPHSAELRATGNAVCIQCHQPSPSARFPGMEQKDYASEAHHFHQPGSPGAQCVNCHMPTKTYMQVDERHDHSFRLPRPDLSAQLGTPNTCNTCHADKSAAWAAAQIEQRFGKQRPAHFAKTFAAAQAGSSAVSEDLLKIATTEQQPGIVRATAFSLAHIDSPAALRQLAAGLEDNDPLVRVGAVRAAEGLDIAGRWQLLSPLLEDRLRAVRGEAARLLAVALNEQLEPPARAKLTKALDEYIAAQRLNADRPEAQTNLGIIYAQTNRLDKVEPAYRKAIALDPGWVPAYINLADFMRAQNRDGEGEQLLSKAVQIQPDNAEVRHALGLWLTRQGRSDEALQNLQTAATLAPQNSRYAYVYAIALNSAGKAQQAILALEAANQRFPGNLDIVYALSTIHRDRGERQKAIDYARQLVAIRPQASAFRQLLQSMER